MTLLEKLLQLLPILAGMDLGKNGKLVFDLITLAEAEIQRRMSVGGRSRTEILQEAGVDWQAGITGADELLKLGHEEV